MTIGISPTHGEMLKARGLDPVLAAQLGARSMPGRDGRMVLAFDYLLRGKVHNTKQRYGKGDMPWTETGKRLILWGLDDLIPPPKDGEALIIVEGEMDRIALRQVGYSRVVSVPNGAPKTSNGATGGERYQYLYKSGDELIADIDKWPTIIIATDGDGPGMALRDDLAVRLGDHRCLWVPWPKGTKDANDVLRAHGAQALIDCINRAKRMWLDLVCSMSEIPDQQPEVGLPLGFAIMDNDLADDGIRIGESGLCTIVGPAHSGKSTFARQLLWNRWRMYGRPFGITALEEGAKPRYQRIFRRYAIGRPMREWTDALVKLADEEIDHAMKIIRPPRNAALDTEGFLAASEYAIKVYGLRDILLDPINELEFDESKRVDAASKSFIMDGKRMADRYKVLMMCVTHPPMDVVRRKKTGELWTLYDAEGGRHGPGKSDFGFGFWRPHPRGPSLIYASKLKTNEIFGRPTLYMANYDIAMDQYTVVRSGFDCTEQVVRDIENGVYDRNDGTAPFQPKPQPKSTGPRYSMHNGGDDD